MLFKNTSVLRIMSICASGRGFTVEYILACHILILEKKIVSVTRKVQRNYPQLATILTIPSGDCYDLHKTRQAMKK